MSKIRGWFVGEEFEERETIENLMKVVSPHADAHEMARDLERHRGWCVDSSSGIGVEDRPLW